MTQYLQGQDHPCLPSFQVETRVRKRVTTFSVSEVIVSNARSRPTS